MPVSVSLHTTFNTFSRCIRNIIFLIPYFIIKILCQYLSLVVLLYLRRGANVSLHIFNISQVKKSYGMMPFNLRSFDDEKKARMGVVECVSHKLVEPYPVLWEKVLKLMFYFYFCNNFVLQFKFADSISDNAIQYFKNISQYKITPGGSHSVSSTFYIEYILNNSVRTASQSRCKFHLSACLPTFFFYHYFSVLTLNTSQTEISLTFHCPFKFN